MIHRVGLFIASLATAAALFVALVLAGFAPGGGAASGATVGATGEVPAAASGQTDPQVQVDTIYLAAPQPPATVTVHRVVPAAGSGEEHEQEGGDD